MKCPKCGTDLWKASVSRKHRIAGKGFIAVNLTCSNCGYNLKAYVIHKDLMVIAGELEEIRRTISELKKPESAEKKSRFNIFGR